MRCRRNRRPAGRPAGTTLAAKDSFSINERRRRFDVFRCPNQDSSSCKSSFSLAGGRCSFLCWESSSIPRYVITVDGPSSLSIATGTPKVVHSCSMSCTDGSGELIKQKCGRSTAKWEASIHVVVIPPIDSEELPVLMPNRDHAKSRL